MDFSKLPRELIYQDRRSITDFAISDEHWVNKALFDQLISFKCIKSKEETTEKLILSIFNDAYYILTIVFLEEFPFLRMAKQILFITNRKRMPHIIRFVVSV